MSRVWRTAFSHPTVVPKKQYGARTGRSMKTKDRIIQAAVELFNAQGEQNITTNHIAAHLSMSPGNLYYHFRNKEDIIRAILLDYAHDLEEYFAHIEGPDTLQMSMEHLERVMLVMWRYRFLYHNLPDILARDQQLHERFRELQQPIYGYMRRHFLALREQQILQASDEELDSLLLIIKQMFLFWHAYQFSLHAESTVSKGRQYEVMPQVLFLVRPYIAPAHQQELARVMAHFLQRIEENSQVVEGSAA